MAVFLLHAGIYIHSYIDIVSFDIKSHFVLSFLHSLLIGYQVIFRNFFNVHIPTGEVRYILPSFRTFLDQSDLEKMLSELVEKVNETFKNNSEQNKDILVHFPNHVHAIGKILESYSLSANKVPSDIAIDVQNILIKLVKEYPQLPYQFQGFAIDAFLNTSKHFDTTNIIYGSLLETCSYPLIPENEDDSNDAMTNTRHFVEFWKRVTQVENILESVIKVRPSLKTSILIVFCYYISYFILQSVISILSKLNFDTETFEVVLSNSNDIVAESQTQQGTLTQVLREEVFENDDIMMVSTVNKPVKIKDHTILANLVISFFLGIA